jgi:hypothetical protein
MRDKALWAILAGLTLVCLGILVESLPPKLAGWFLVGAGFAWRRLHR